MDLDRVLADDARIDAIGRGSWPAPRVAVRSAHSTGPHRTSGRVQFVDQDEPLFELFDQWRQELAARPLPGAPRRAAAPPAAHARRPRTWRSVLAVAAAIGAVVVGSATIGAAEAEPDGLLWPITQMIWPSRAHSAESARAAQIALAQARDALHAGRSGDARQAIIKAAIELRNVQDDDIRDSMADEITHLLSVSAAIAPAAPSAPRSPRPNAPATPVPGPFMGIAASVGGGPPPVGPASSGPVHPASAAAAASAAPSAANANAAAAAAADAAAGDPGASAAPIVSAPPAGAQTPLAPEAAAPVTSVLSPEPTPSTSSTPAPTLPPPSVVVDPPTPTPPATTEASSATEQSAPSPTETTPSTGAPEPQGLVLAPAGSTDGGPDTPPAAVPNAADAWSTELTVGGPSSAPGPG